MNMTRTALQRVAIGAIALLAACSTENAPGPLQPTGPVARIRFVNLITDPARLPVNAILENLPFGVNLGYGGTTPASLAAPNTANYAQILAGARTLELERTADPTVTVATIAITMAEDEDRTVYAIGGTAGGAVTDFQTVDDNTAPAAGMTRLRVVNLSPAAGAVDVFVTAAGADLSTAQPTFANVGVTTASGYVSTLAGTYVVRAVPAGTPSVSRNGAVTFTVAAASYPALGGRTIVIADAAAGGAPLRGFVYTDR
jgi:hypothetical protein